MVLRRLLGLAAKAVLTIAAILTYPAGLRTTLKNAASALEPTPLQRFLTVNRDRIRRMREGMLPRQTLVFDLLPLLLHTNHAALPGFVSPTTPAGIADYQPSQLSLKAAQKLVKGYTLPQKAARQNDVLGLYFMGSSGSIAHSEESDYDIWLCHGPWLNEGQVEELRQKTVAIENWALENGVEAHFFVFNAAQFKNGSYQQLSTESSGSTQHYLLLDEFYRSSLIIAGLVPIWFEVPPEHEHEYDAYVTELIQRTGAERQVYVDFGGVGQVPAEEFFGATLWQLYKSINSPFKSVLKLLLMEVYAAEFPHIDMLSMQFKRAVYSGESDLLALDPYLSMYGRIEQLLQKNNDTMRIEVLRKCFYLKIGEPLSKQRRGSAEGSWRRAVLLDLVRSWQWDVQQPALLDNKNQWQLETVLQERRDLISTITQCYRMLSQFARTHAEISRISQADLVILGRKLYTAFERKAGKIDVVNRGIVETLHVSEGAFRITQNAESGPRWTVVLGAQNGAIGTEESTFKNATSIVEIICWAYFNKIIDGRTHLVLHAPLEAITLREVKAIIDTLARLFPEGRTFHPETQDLVNAPRLLTAVVFVNVGRDPLPSHSNDGRHLASARTNTLSYGSERHNLALTIDLLIESSWGELFTFHYRGVTGLFDCIKDYLRWTPPSKRNLPPAPIIHCFSSTYGAVIHSGLTRLIQGIIHAFYSKRGSDAARYVVDVENRHYILQCVNDDISYKECPSFSALLRQLSAPSPVYTRTIIDEQSLQNSLLPLLHTANHPGEIDFFLQVLEQHVEIYILDEEGAMHIQVLPHYDKRLLLQQYMLFFAAINRRRFFLTSNGDMPFRDPRVNFYAITKDSGNRRALQEIRYNFDTLTRQYFNIQVIVSALAEGERSFTVYCNDREFSSVQYGSKLFHAVAKHVLAMRKSGQTYPMYITDIDLSTDLIGEHGDNPLQTIYFLNYKKNIEDRLNEAMNHITVP